MPNEIIRAFLETIGPWRTAYRDVRISYLAERRGGRLILIQGKADHIIVDVPLTLEYFSSARITGGQFLLSKVQRDLHWFLSEIELGVLHTPKESIVVSPTPPNSSEARVTLSRLHADGLAARQRTTVLTILAGPTARNARREELDWELRASSTPYDGLGDLATELSLNPQRLDHAFFVVPAPNAAEIDLGSKIENAVARPGCFLAEGLSPSDFALHYRVIEQRRVTVRSVINGDQMQWESRGALKYGSTEFRVSSGAVVHCIAVVNGHAHHHGWIADPTAFANPRRTVLETYDPSLSATAATLFDAMRKGGGDTRAVESGIAWLLWMLGFSPAHLGGTKQLQDGPDILACTPGQNIMLVECTTGLLTVDKLTRLAERRSRLRRRLDDTGHNHVRILAMIVTTMERTDAQPGIEQAERLGILAIARPDIEQLLVRSLVLQDPEALFREAEDTVRAAQERHSAS